MKSASNGEVVAGAVSNEVEVLTKGTRRRFSAEYKLKILRQAGACFPPVPVQPWALDGSDPVLQVRVKTAFTMVWKDRKPGQSACLLLPLYGI